MTRNRDDLQRRRRRRQPEPRFLIVCEGRVTEPRYFKDVQHTERSPIDLEIEPGGIDAYPLIPEAKNQARANGIELAISNPCFELWALLHFQGQSAHIERGRVQHLCRLCMPGYEKRLDYEALRPKYPDALKRAEDLEKWHASRGTAGANPSTTVYKLVERIKSQASSY